MIASLSSPVMLMAPILSSSRRRVELKPVETLPSSGGSGLFLGGIAPSPVLLEIWNNLIRIQIKKNH